MTRDVLPDGGRVAVMAVVNRTPDSFYDRGATFALGRAVEAALITALKAAHGGLVQTATEAGIPALQRKDWNAAQDQLDWRRKYYFTESGRPSPRDYSKLLSLDDAVIVEVNLSFGLEPEAEDRTLPVLTAAARAYRADTTRMLWSREERLSDTTSSSTVTEFRAEPVDLTNRLFAMSEPLALQIAGNLARDVGLVPPPPPIAVETTPANGSAPEISTSQAPPPPDAPPAEMPTVAPSTGTTISP